MGSKEESSAEREKYQYNREETIFDLIKMKEHATLFLTNI